MSSMNKSKSIIKIHDKDKVLILNYEEFEQYLKTLKNGRVRQYLNPKYIKRIICYVSKFLNETNCNHTNISIYHIETFLEKRKSRNFYLSRIKHLIRFYEHKGLISKKRANKLLNIRTKDEKIPILNPEDKKKFSIPKSQWDEVYNQLPTNSHRIACFLGFSFGLRASEILNLTLKDIDFKHKCIYITSNNKPIPWSPKTKSSFRRIPMTEKEEKILKKFILRRKSNSEYLIYSNHGKAKVENRPLSINWFAFALKKVKIELPDIGLKSLRPHILRYSFATHIYYNTTAKDPLMVLSNLLGHTKVDVTYKYLNLSESEMQQKMKESKEKANL